MMVMPVNVRDAVLDALRESKDTASEVVSRQRSGGMFSGESAKLLREIERVDIFLAALARLGYEIRERDA